MSSQFKDLEESPIVQVDIKLRVESLGISSTLRIIALFGVIGEGDCFSGSRWTPSKRASGMLRLEAEKFLNMDGAFDPRRWNLRREFDDWIEESSPHPPFV